MALHVPFFTELLLTTTTIAATTTVATPAVALIVLLALHWQWHRARAKAGGRKGELQGKAPTPFTSAHRDEAQRALTEAMSA